MYVGMVIVAEVAEEERTLLLNLSNANKTVVMLTLEQENRYIS